MPDDRLKPLLIHNAQFISDGRHLRFKAIIVKHGRIDRILSMHDEFPTFCERIDLDGRYVLPGFTDSHTHLISRGVELQRIDLGSCRTAAECLEQIQRAVRSGCPIAFASNFDETSWEQPVGTPVDRRQLDAISKSVPIIMRRVCGHFAVVNSPALARVSKHWRLVDRAHGHLHENAALYLNRIFKPDLPMAIKAVQLGIKEALRHGITSVHEIGDPQRLALLQKIRRGQGLAIRFSVYVINDRVLDIVQAGLQSGLGDDHLRFSGIKVFLDGSIGAKTAALKKPYRHLRTRGRLLVSPQELEDLIVLAERHCLQLMVHAIGDRTAEMAVKAFEKHIDPANPLRHRLEHCELLQSDTINRMARLNLIASMQPNFVRRWQQNGGMYEQLCGARFRSMNCFNRMQRAGIKIIFGSDCMPMNPWYGISGAVEHPSPAGRLSRKDALIMYTRTPAYATFEETTKGSIKEGMFADLIVLDEDPLRSVSFDTLKVLMVMVGGRIAYRRIRT